MRKLHSQIEAYRDVELTEASNMTLGEWLDKWLSDYMALTIRESTMDSYKAMTKHYIKPYLGDEKIGSVTTADIQKLYNWLRENGRVNEHYEKGNALSDSLFAMAIHVLYYFPAPFDFFVHKWGAGDILTYVSTIALSLLAVWQNQKFKEESDKAQEVMERQNKEAQERLERISIEANELSVISRIIDQEDKYLSRLEEAALTFLNASSGGTLLTAINKAIDSNDPLAVSGADIEMRHAHDRLMAIYLSGMRTDGTELLTLMDAFGVLYEEASKVFTKILAEKDYHFLSVDDYAVTFDRAENALQVFCLSVGN